MMKRARTLSPEDAAAVDLLLDNVAARGGVVKVAGGVAQPRLAAATRLLALLDRTPAAEPPAGLAARTLAAVEGRRAAVVPTACVGSRSAMAFH